jgi:hypothetical protein
MEAVLPEDDLTLSALNECLDVWLKFAIKDADARTALLGTSDGTVGRLQVAAESVRPFLRYLAEELDHLDADQLEALAEKLSPGDSYHEQGLLARIVLLNVPFVSARLLAAMIRRNWHGGKVGFQFLPDPATSDPDAYDGEALDLMETLYMGVAGDPRTILTGDDLSFFESLPDRLTVYRGAAGISPDLAGTGVCWTTRRDVAEWFATRHGASDPMVVSARVSRAEIAFVKACEFEVVVKPRRCRTLKLRRHGGVPVQMQWSPPAEPARPAAK